MGIVAFHPSYATASAMRAVSGKISYWSFRLGN